MNLVRIRVRLLLLGLVLAGCSSSPEATPAIEPATVVRVEPAKTKPRAEVMAGRVMAALASGEVEQLRPLFSREGWRELEDIARASFRKLRARFDEEGIDLATVELTRVETTGSQVEMVDVHLVAAGKRYRTHFSAMAGTDYQLLGVAEWLKRER